MELASPLPPRVRKSNARLGLICTALIVLVAGYGATQATGFQWFLLRASLRSQYPRVQWITTRELADMLEDRQRRPPILLDVRTLAEWNVSHLADAWRVDPAASMETVATNIEKDTPFVAYCAVGYRSAALAKRLSAAGFTHVQVLDGGIFAWANEHRPMVRDNEPATRVHPYHSFWGRLLNPDVRAPNYN